MTTDELIAINETVCEKYRQAFREVGRKDHSPENDVRKYLDELRWELEGIAKQKRTTDDVVKAKENLDRLIADAAKHEYGKGGDVPLRVQSRLERSAEARKAMFLAQDSLIPKQVESRIKTEVNRGITAPTEEEARRKAAVKQAELFHELPEFCKIPMKIRFIHKDTGRPDVVLYVESTVWQRESSIKLHQAQQKRVNDSLNAEIEANKLLKPLVTKHGDLYPPDLWAKAHPHQRTVH